MEKSHYCLDIRESNATLKCTSKTVILYSYYWLQTSDIICTTLKFHFLVFIFVRGCFSSKYQQHTYFPCVVAIIAIKI